MAKADWAAISRQILAALDIRAEYESLGVEVTGKQPNKKGWLQCRALGRSDKNPSAEFNVEDGPGRGRYTDWSTGERLGLFDFAALHGPYEDWKAARKHYAGVAGVELPKGGGNVKKPGDDLAFQDWNDGLAQAWCTLHKRGVTVEAIKASGGRLGKWPKKSGKYLVLVLPVFGLDLTESEPIGWVAWHRGGRELPVYQGKGVPPKWVKMKTLAGSKKGWMGAYGLSKLSEAEVVWKTEGPADMMALHAIIPEELRSKHVVITNSAGAGEIPEPDMLACLAGKTVHILHDCDKPGQGGPENDTGAWRWSKAATAYAGDCRNVVLPYEIAESHGKDVRDWINEGGTWDELLKLAEQANVIGGKVIESELSEEAKTQEDPGPDPEDPEADVVFEKSVLADIQLEVVSELQNQKVKVYSLHHRKSDVISDVSKLTAEKLIQLCGPPVQTKLNEGTEFIAGMYQLKTIKRAISAVAGFRRYVPDAVVGLGCWRGKTIHGEETDSIVLVGCGESARLNGEIHLKRRESPREDGLILDFEGSRPWYEFSRLRSLVVRAHEDKDWCREVIMETEQLFSRWRWKHQENDPTIVTGLLMATWVQTFWKWRPQVAIIGASSSGKTTLFQALGGDEHGGQGMFGGLSMLSSQSTEAGIRQAIRNSAAVLLCDEFEDSKDRAKVLSLFRTTGRGSKILRGTASQSAEAYGLRHIPWVAAIEVGLRREPDRNRFITLELVPPPDTEWGKLVVPEEEWLIEQGQKLLAISVANVRDAVPLAASLKRTGVPGVDKRVIESYSVPVAMLSCALSANETEARGLLSALLDKIEKLDQGRSDSDDLMEAIMSSWVDCGHGEKHSVSQIFQNELLLGQHMDSLERSGISRVSKGHGRWSSSRPEDKYLYVIHRTVCARLLRGTEWENQQLEQLLKRIEGAHLARARVAGSLARGVRVPWSWICEKFLEVGPDEDCESDF